MHTLFQDQQPARENVANRRRAENAGRAHVTNGASLQIRTVSLLGSYVRLEREEQIEEERERGGWGNGGEAYVNFPESSSDKKQCIHFCAREIHFYEFFLDRASLTTSEGGFLYRSHRGSLHSPG